MPEKTRRVWIERDEWWPVYSFLFEEPSYMPDDPVDVPEALIERHAGALKEFDAVQDLIQKLPGV